MTILSSARIEMNTKQTLDITLKVVLYISQEIGFRTGSV